MSYKPKILVVDNDKATLRQFEATLSAMGATPCCLNSSRQAAMRLNKEKFDGVFLNWDIPELKGEDLTRMIRRSKSNATIPIAMLTGRHDTDAIAQGFKLGVTFFLSKPVSAKEIARLLNASRGAMLEDRRRYHRVPLRVPVVCQWENRKVTGESVNVSVRGLLLAVNPTPKPAANVALQLALPLPPAELKLEGTVARTAPENCVGIKFNRVDPDQEQTLKAYVDRSLGSGSSKS